MKTIVLKRIEKNESRSAGQVKKHFWMVSLGLVMIVICSIPADAHAARERYVLDFDDSHIRGFHREPATIFLKRTLKEQYPYVNIKRMELQKVVLVAKSKRGRGGAELQVGQDRTDNYQVYANPWDFKRSSRHTFDRVRFDNPARDSRGPWQMDLWGNLVVRKVVLVVDERRRYKKRNNRGDSRDRRWNFEYRQW